MSDGSTDASPSAADVTLPFEVFYTDHLGEVHRALTIALGSSDVAADAAAEAMARAYARWDRVSEYERPAAWVYRVAVNWATSRFRKRRRETLTSFEPGSIAAARRDGDGRVTDEPRPADPQLARALAELSVEQRSVVVLRYLLDWSEADTAAALGVAPGTVKSRLNRALARLAERLDHSSRPHDADGGER